jgi:prolyl 4-hydroxylase
MFVPTILLLCALYAKAEIATKSIPDVETLTKMLGAEDKVLAMVEKYIERESKRLAKLKDFAKEYESQNKVAMKDGLKMIANPVNAFLLIKRLTSDWSFVQELMQNTDPEDLIAEVAKRRKDSGVDFPTRTDLNVVAHKVMDIQDKQKLEAAEIAKGKFGKEKTIKMDAHDCFWLGRVAYLESDHYHCLMWMQEALEQVKKEEPPTIPESEIIDHLAYCMYHQGNIERAIVLTKRLADLEPGHPRGFSNVKWYEDELEQAGKSKKIDPKKLPALKNKPINLQAPKKDEL